MNGTILIHKWQMIKMGDSYNQSHLGEIDLEKLVLVTIAVLCHVRIDYTIWFAWEKKSLEENLFAYVLYKT